MYTLLIVDDEPSILEGLKRTLEWEKLGIRRIEVARSCDEALVKAIDHTPHICLVDVCIGNEKGYNLITRIFELGINTTVLMMSGYEEFQYAIESMRCGAKNYLLKPIDSEELKQAIEKIIVKDLHGKIPESDDKAERDPVLMIEYTALPSLINKILMMVRADFNRKITLKSIADCFKMNPTYLGQLFLKETRLKFSEYLMVYRLLKAQELILHTDEKIVWIANEVGYQNMNYFYLHFRDYFNISPSDMRNMPSEENQNNSA